LAFLQNLVVLPCTTQLYCKSFIFIDFHAEVGLYGTESPLHLSLEGSQQYFAKLSAYWIACGMLPEDSVLASQK